MQLIKLILLVFLFIFVFRIGANINDRNHASAEDSIRQPAVQATA